MGLQGIKEGGGFWRQVPQFDLLIITGWDGVMIVCCGVSEKFQDAGETIMGFIDDFDEIHWKDRRRGTFLGVMYESGVVDDDILVRIAESFEAWQSES